MKSRLFARSLTLSPGAQKLRLIFQMPVLNCLMCQIVFLFTNFLSKGKPLAFTFSLFGNIASVAKGIMADKTTE